MPIPCVGCATPLPERADFCPRCGRAAGSSVVVKESTESLLRQVASMLQKHSRRKLVVKFISPWGFEYGSPQKKIASLRFFTRLSFFESVRAFVVAPGQGKTLFLDSSWADITVEVFQETGFDDAKAFAEAYRAHKRGNVEILKKYM